MDNNRTIDRNDYAINKLIDNIKFSSRKEDFILSVSKVVECMGFTAFDFIYVNDQVKINCFITTVPEALIKAYCDEKLSSNDVWYDVLRATSIGIFASEVRQFLLASPVRTMMIERGLLALDLAAAYGFDDFYCFPVKSNLIKGRVLFSVLSEGDSSNELKRKVHENRKAIHWLAEVSADYIRRHKLVFDMACQQKKILTSRQLDILDALSRHSMTQKQVAEKFGVSVRTIETHCDVIKKRLNKPTITGALYEAVRVGEILID